MIMKNFIFQKVLQNDKNDLTLNALVYRHNK